MMLAAGKGRLEISFGTQVERIDINPYGVDPSLGDKRSTKEAGPHPALSDPMAGLAFLVSAIALAGSGAFPLVLARLARRDDE